MNLLGLVFSIMLILSLGTYVCFEKQLGASRLRSTYLSCQRVNRKIFNSYQSQVYRDCSGKATEPKQKRNQLPPKEDEDEIQEDEEENHKNHNRECAKVNLWPLIQEGKEAHPTLYQLMVSLIHTFYAQLSQNQKHFAQDFLDQFLECAKKSIALQKETFSLEKIFFPKQEHQKAYYYMLKGTKKWDLGKNVGFPPLLDYVTATPDETKICVSHANLDLLRVLFGDQAAVTLHQSIHSKNRAPLTKEYIRGVCHRSPLLGVDEALLELLEAGYPEHHEKKKIFVAEDGETSLRKNIFL